MALAQVGQRDRQIVTELDYRDSSGLAVPNFFDWPARLREQLAREDRPEAVVLFLGANDDKIMQGPRGIIGQLTPAWQVEYARRAGVVMDIVGEQGGQLYWVGMPIMREQWRYDNAAMLNAAVADAAASRPWVHLIDLWTLFADDQGNFTLSKPDEQGVMIVVRLADGVHLTRPGTDWVAARLYADLRRDWAFAGR